MKLNVFFIATLFLFGLSASAFASVDSGTARLAVIPMKGSEVFKVIYEGEKIARLKLNVYDASSKLIFTETMHSGGFIRPLNFAGLSAGQYTVEISYPGGRSSERITFNPLSRNPEAKAVHITRLKSDGKYLIAVENSQDESIAVNFYDEGDNLIHHQAIRVTGEYAAVYNAGNFKVSTISVVDQSGHKTVRQF